MVALKLRLPSVLAASTMVGYGHMYSNGTCCGTPLDLAAGRGVGHHAVLLAPSILRR